MDIITSSRFARRQRFGRHRIVAGIALVTVVSLPISLAACGGDSGASAVSAHAPATEPDDVAAASTVAAAGGEPAGPDALAAWSSAVDSSGHLAPDVALGWFAAGVAPLHDVVPASPTPPASLAMAAVDQVWSGLDEARRTEITTALSALASTGANAVSATTGANGIRRTQRPTPAEDAQAALHEVEGRLGRPLQAMWDTRIAGPGELTWPVVTYPQWDELGKLEKCLSVIGDGFTVLGESEQHSLLAGEAMRCLQLELLQASGITAAPLWALLGEQAWVGETLAGPAGTSRSASWWDRWLGTPTVPLTSRLYDAIGWFASVDTSTPSIWSSLDSIVELPDVAIGGIDPKAAEEWGTRLARLPGVSTWDSFGPGITSTRAPIAEAGAVVGPFLEVPAATAWVGKLPALTDPVRLRPDQLAGGVAVGSSTFHLDDGVTLCPTAESCVCPDGSASVVGPTAVVGTETVLVAASSAAGGKVFADPVTPTCPDVTTSTIDPASLLNGQWVSTEWKMPPALFGAATGGAGIRLAIDDGTAAIDFSGMEPITSTVDASGSTVVQVMTFTGGGAGPATIDASLGTFTAEYDDPTIQFVYSMAVDGISVTSITVDGRQAANSVGFGVPATAATYRFEGGNLILAETIPGSDPIEIVFARA